MPRVQRVNTSAFVGSSEQLRSCSCYKCRVRKEVATFSVYLAELPQYFGGIHPRNYHPNNDFNASSRRDSEDYTIRPDNPELSLEQIEQVKFNVKATCDYNRGVAEKLSANMRQKYEFCFDCGKLHKADMTHSLIIQGVTRHVCGDCVRLRYRYCLECSTLKSKYEFVRMNTEYICKICFDRKYYRCSRCDHSFVLGDEYRFVFTFPDGRSSNQCVCPNCRSQLHICMGCGHTFFDSVRSARDRRGFCPQCAEDRSQIKQYSYKPTPRYRTESFQLPSKSGNKTEQVKPHSLMLGFEAEFENYSEEIINEDVALAITEIMGEGFMYYKRDGSLQSGFEAVTHPFSEGFYIANRAKLAAMMEKVVNLGMKADSRCGFHCHMTKRAFSIAHLYKFIKFIYDPANRDWIVNLSRRGGVNHYAYFHDEDTKRAVRFAKQKMNASHERHSAINCTGEKTLEVRFFKGVGTPLELFCALDFVFALYNYTKDCSFKKLKVWDFMEWLAQRQIANKFRYLVIWLKDNGFVSNRDKKNFKKLIEDNHVNLNLKKGE